MATGRALSPAVRGAREFAGSLRQRFGQNDLLTFASAISFQVLIALVALGLFGLALLDLLSLTRVWKSSIQPFVEARLAAKTFDAIVYTVDRIFSTESAFLLVFALALTIWEVSGAVRALMGALNRIYGSEEDRSSVRRFGISFALALCVTIGTVGAVLSTTVLRHAEFLPGAFESALGWCVGIALLASVVWLLLRFAPCADRSATWISTGSLLIITAWIIASIGFRYYATNVASYTSAIGNLAAVLTFTGYLYTSSIIFLTGAQIDELLRQQASVGKSSPLDLSALLERRSERKRRPRHAHG